MNEMLYRYMADSSLLSQKTLQELEQVVETYPYFSTVRMLYLKNLAVLNDARFKQELQKTAVYVPDRKMLFMLIEEVRLIVETDTKRKPEEKEDTFLLIDEFLESHNNQLGNIDADPGLLFPPSVSTDYLTWYEKGRQIEISDSDPKLQSQVLVDGFIKEAEGRTTSGWMLLEPGQDNTVEAPTQMGEYNSSDDSFFTETLAKIYIKQRKYGKALEIIRNISLKDPKKNIYFADQIRFLEILIINTKNKI